MKTTITIMLLILSSLSFADLELKVSNVRYGLGTYGQYSFKAYQAGYGWDHKGYRFSVLGGQSESGEGYYMRNFFTFGLTRQFDLINQYSVLLGATYSEYKAGSAQWGENSDTGEGWTLGLVKRINSRFSVKLSIDDYYTKHHKVIGTERTTSTGFSLMAGI